MGRSKLKEAMKRERWGFFCMLTAGLGVVVAATCIFGFPNMPYGIKHPYSGRFLA